MTKKPAHQQNYASNTAVLVLVLVLVLFFGLVEIFLIIFKFTNYMGRQRINRHHNY